MFEKTSRACVKFYEDKKRERKKGMCNALNQKLSYRSCDDRKDVLNLLSMSGFLY